MLNTKCDIALTNIRQENNLSIFLAGSQILAIFQPHALYEIVS